MERFGRRLGRWAALAVLAMSFTACNNDVSNSSSCTIQGAQSGGVTIQCTSMPSSPAPGNPSPPMDTSSATPDISPQPVEISSAPPPVAPPAPPAPPAPDNSSLPVVSPSPPGPFHVIDAKIGFFGWADNLPANSATISYPNPPNAAALHATAGGTGTWDDPITFAGDKSAFPVGTTIWVPYFHKYFIMEDDCSTCDTAWHNSGQYMVRLWAGKAQSNNLFSEENCERALTPASPIPIFVWPPKNEPVSTNPLFDPSTGACFTNVVYKNAPGSQEIAGIVPPAPVPQPSTSGSGSGSNGKCKRGIAWDLDTLADAHLLAKGVHWWYNWSPSPRTAVNGGSAAVGMEFVPMVWSAANLGSSLTPSSAVLGFNEPDIGGQANMSPQTAATAWTSVEDMARKSNIPKLVSPAIAYQASWLSQFLSSCAGCQVDALALHVYATSAQKVLDQVHAVEALNKSKPVWLTEFACEDFGTTPPTTCSLSQQKALMQGVIPQLESDPSVERYAWFSGTDTNVPNSQIIQNGQLTELGQMYVNAQETCF